MRPGEVDGVDYFFVSKKQFEAWLDQGELLEHALVYGDYKGIPRSQVFSSMTILSSMGRSCLSYLVWQLDETISLPH